MAAIAPAKEEFEALEIEKVNISLNELPLPTELAQLSSDELVVIEKRLVRKLDTFLLPTCAVLFLLNILDRNNIANAKISGLTKTLNMTNTEYNTCLLMFYVGYIMTQLPSNMLITRIRPSLYICLTTAAWGIVSMCQGFTKNFAGLLLNRLVLGLVEGPFLPGVMFLMSCWYKRSELPPRIALLYGANMLATAFGGLIAAGIISRMEGKLGRPAWEWLFIIEGSITIAVAIIVIPMLPDYPGQSKIRWLPQELQLMAEWRIRKENAGIVDEDMETMWWGLKQALIDPKLYMFVVLQMSLLTAQSFNNFFPSIVGTLGYNTTITLLLTAPPYFFAFICSISISFHAAYQKERGYHIAIPMMFALIGNLLAMFLPSTGGRYFSMFLMTAGSYSPYNLCISWLSSSLPRPKVKRASALAIINLMGAGVAHFYTVYMFPDSQKPRYYAGGGVMCGACLVCTAMAMAIKRHLKNENQKFELVEMSGEIRQDGIKGSETGHGGEAVVSFRYVH
ncbi:hypothetical protein BP5796_12474 [Coleophoma crateriformis]|uniref:Major facilitator superfamily (MFS) profile domain-containing protein n=1 Tax=Coleophoma crateriformis TaxID=565419 RepID=A0A3D8Q780_9HELO|nr:hypothetical protein BP5796_12474 [Coleophoma crateriformis]